MTNPHQAAEKALDRLVEFAEGRYPYSDDGSASEDFATVRAALAAQQTATAEMPEKLGNTPTPVVLDTAADMLDEAAQRLGGLVDMPVVATKLRSLRAPLALQGGGEGWRPTHRHVKRGSDYQEIGRAELQQAGQFSPAEGDTLVVYQGKDGKLWARAASEFDDGRFEKLPAAPAPKEPSHV